MNGVKRTPQRTCIGCRSIKDKKELIRIVRGEDKIVSIDLTGKKNGRGAYICPDTACLDKAVKNHALERSFKTALQPGLIEQIRREIEQIDK